MPPTTPPAPTPARAARIGPAAIKGPIPGTAMAPTPASHPKTPPITAPVPAPAEAPSGEPRNIALDFLRTGTLRWTAFKYRSDTNSIHRSFVAVNPKLLAGNRKFFTHRCGEKSARPSRCSERLHLSISSSGPKQYSHRLALDAECLYFFLKLDALALFYEING